MSTDAVCNCRVREGSIRINGGASFALDSGETLTHVDLKYAVYGEPSAAVDNVILVCHALSGSANVADWWPQLLASLDPARNCIVCFNVLGSCYGSTGPTSLAPATSQPYRAAFPRITVRDMVRAQALAADALGFARFKAVVGGSIGGMQALQWAIEFPERVGKCVAIGACPLGAMGLGLNEIQRQILELDPAFKGGNYLPDEPPAQGIAIARALAICSYKSNELFAERHGRKPNRVGPAPWESPEGRYDVVGYLDHQGEKFERRFDANSYITLTHAMDAFDPEQECGGASEAFARVKCPVLLIGISSDWLFPAEDVRAFSECMKSVGVNVQYTELVSAHGHDAFLAEPEQLLPVTTQFLGE